MRFLQRGAWANNPIIRPGRQAEFFTYEQLRRMTIGSLKAYLRRRIGGYTVAVKDMPTVNRLYRGRVCRERPRIISEISYPSPDKVNKYGGELAPFRGASYVLFSTNSSAELTDADALPQHAIAKAVIDLAASSEAAD